jgi:hypothetical protein
MWILMARAPAPDVPYWPGRRWIAGLDALGWPLAGVLLLADAPMPTGSTGLTWVASATWCALGRVHRALWAKHRHRFMTWRWGRAAAALLLIGFVPKMSASI